MKNTAVNDVIDFGYGTDIARVHFVDFQSFLTLKHDRSGDLEGFLAVIDVQSGVFGNATLVQTEQTDLANVRVVDHFKDVGKHRTVGIREGHVFRTVRAVKERCVGFGRIRQVTNKHFDQVAHADQILSGGVADRNDVA